MGLTSSARSSLTLMKVDLSLFLYNISGTYEGSVDIPDRLK